MTVTNANREHSSKFSCRATNKWGTVERNFDVKVVMKPYWTKFTEWSACTVTCGKGFQVRYRRCTFPDGFSAQESCEGETAETQACTLAPCIVDGGWSEWSDWTKCSRPCGVGYQVQERKCDNPVPSDDGKNCEGDEDKYRYCKLTNCTRSSDV